MEEKIKTYLREQMDNPDFNRVIVLKDWIVLGIAEPCWNDDEEGVYIVLYDAETHYKHWMDYFADEEDLQSAYDYIIDKLAGWA